MLSLTAESSNSPPSSALKLELAKALELKQQRRNRNKLAAYKPYIKQREFHRSGSVHDERLFMAGNQLGKTLAGAMETAIHLTGRYPDWWDGAVFQKPTKFWVGGVSGEAVRDNPQRLLIGPPQIKGAWGTGAIPGDALIDFAPARGVADLLDSVVIKHGGGADVQQGESILLLKSYEKGREKWQGDTIDGLWDDEEPPIDIYSEGRTRTQNGQRGIFVYLTFTPLLGMSEVVRMFLTEDAIKGMK